MNQEGIGGFKKGQSGNPGGRTPKSDELRRAEEMLANLSPLAVEKLKELLETGDTKTQATVALGIVKSTIGELSRVASANGASLLGPFGEMTKDEILELARCGK